MAVNPLSISKLTDCGCDVVFTSYGCFVHDRCSKKLIGIGRGEGGLYVMQQLSVPPMSSFAFSSFRVNKHSFAFHLWHSRLGHVSSSRLRYMLSTGSLGHVPYYSISDCVGCKLGKFSAIPFNKSNYVTSAPFELVHSNVWGPALVSSQGGSYYYVSFIDDYSQYCWVYLMKNRSDFYHIYCQFVAMV